MLRNIVSMHLVYMYLILLSVEILMMILMRQAVKSKSVRDYVRWMMYWIVFAAFTTLETILDPFMVFW